MVNTIVANVINNAKRMSKLRSLKGSQDIRNKAESYVIGEAATLHAKLSREDVIKAAVLVANAV